MRRLSLAISLVLALVAVEAHAAPASAPAADSAFGELGKTDRKAPLPRQMQGRWREAGDPSVELIVSGGEILWQGRVVDYDSKEVTQEEGGLTVTLEVWGWERQEALRRSITGLVITPEGEFQIFNPKFATTFERKGR
ncbi:hypothetical protein CFHF_09620 [Caulobacter flavus]|jgi:hypothetical protein|uniref:Uncharacterized protein n=1 Tax=Caulobacter flavus TaxID=1679497 RepID=A0A2N5CV65_9CAUL|nr:hypothetical protein [Caulobacter flavus]AYV45457.1 hypothetical protein C1707_03905 [Caulobacter flavus]PLR17689.1 hypothetical protein CFHF_09620 [Caulobacter flavus]